MNEPAPAFQLPNQDGVRTDLAEFRGHYLLLWWYPKADTPG
jgi:peroxiredoxin Q/BCP